MSDTIFGKIISGEIPSEFLYEDEHCIAINDINPQAPTHILIIPKQPIDRLSNVGDEVCCETLCEPADWPLAVVVAITATGPKSIGSTEAMEISRQT